MKSNVLIKPVYVESVARGAIAQVHFARPGSANDAGFPPTHGPLIIGCRRLNQFHSKAPDIGVASPAATEGVTGLDCP